MTVCLRYKIYDPVRTAVCDVHHKNAFYLKYIFASNWSVFIPAPKRDDVLVSQQGRGTWAPAGFYEWT
jgi:hypothetical protein